MKIRPILLLLTLAGCVDANAQTSPVLKGLTVNGKTVLNGFTQGGPSTTGSAPMNFPAGSAPTAPNNGDVWNDGTGLWMRVAGVSVGPFISAASVGNNITPVLTNFASPAALTAAFPSPAPGKLAWVTNCQNGSESGGGATGCIYKANDSGTWVANPSPPSGSITVGSISISLNGTGSAPAAGTGTKIQTANGVQGVVGNAPAFDATGALIDSGVPPSGGAGGSGTVTTGTKNAIPTYTAAGTGTTLGQIAIVNNSVLTINGTGVPSESTTLPAALTIPSATISNPNITGTATVAVQTNTGRLTTAVSAIGGAMFTIPQGVAPTSPLNGDLWATTAGLFQRYNSTTKGPLIASTDISATAPIVFSGNVISLAQLETTIPINWNATTQVTNDTYFVPHQSIWNTGTVLSLEAFVGGANTPSFNVTLAVNGVSVTGCTNIAVPSTATSSSPVTATCTPTAFTAGQSVSVVTSGVAGNPASSYVGVNISHTGV